MKIFHGDLPLAGFETGLSFVLFASLVSFEAPIQTKNDTNLKLGVTTHATLARSKSMPFGCVIRVYGIGTINLAGEPSGHSITVEVVTTSTVVECMEWF